MPYAAARSSIALIAICLAIGVEYGVLVVLGDDDQRQLLHRGEVQPLVKGAGAGRAVADPGHGHDGSGRACARPSQCRRPPESSRPAC